MRRAHADALGSTINAPLVNQGTLLVQNTAGGSINGAFSQTPGSILKLDDKSGYTSLTISGAFTNDGTIALSTESSYGYNATLTISSGTLTTPRTGRS